MRNINVLLTMLAVLLFTATAHADLVGLGLNTTYGSIVYNSDDSITLSETGGHDFWGNNDRGFLAYEAMPVSGDGEIIARLKYDTSGGGWSRIGIDWRESLAPNAARFGADLADSNGGKIENSHRNNTGNNMERDGDVNNQTLDWNWVRVTREGNVFQAYRSPDGSDWTAYGAASTINFAGAEGYVGIFAHGRNNNSFTTATFSNLGGFLTQADGDLNSIGSGFWDVAATWNGTVVGGVPTDMSLVTIDDTLGLPDVVTVRDMTSIAKRLTIQDASSLAIQAGQLLTVDGTVTATGTGPIAFGTGAQLVANGGGSIATVTTTGDNTLNTGGAMSVATWTDSATAGTLTKAGDGRLTLDNSGGTIDLDNTTVRISGGTLAFQDGLDPLGGAVLPVQLDGGTFSIEGVVGTAEGVVNYGLYNGASNNANLTDIDDGAVNGQNGGLFALTPTETSAWGGEIYQGDLGSNYSVMWTGTFRPAATGEYEFWTHGDDFEVLLMDLNQNGEFDGAAEHVTTNVQPAGWNEPQTSALIPLTAGQDYEFAFVGWEIGGGGWAEMSITAPGGSRVRVNPGAETGGQWIGTGNLAINQTGIDFVVTEDSGINARTDQAATFGSLTLQNGIVTTTGATAGVSFTSTTIAPTATRVGIAPESTTDYGNALSGRPGLTFALGGSADKTLAAAYTNPGDIALTNMTDATIEVAGGTTILNNKALLAGSTNVVLGGGTMRLAAPVAVPSADPGAVTAGMAIRFDASNGVITNEEEVVVWGDTAPGADGTYNASVDWASPVWVDNAFNGNAVMRFDGTNQQRLSFTEYMDMESVLWVVQENEGASGRNPLLGDGDYYPFNRQEGGGPMVGGYASPEVRDGVTTLNGGQIDIMAVPPPNEMGIIGVVMTGPLTQIDAFGGPSNGIPTGVSQIGQDRFEDTRSWDGDFADIIIYNRQLTTAEMTQMTRHLAFRYSIPVEQPMEDFSGVDMTVTADSTLEVGGTVDIGLAGLTLQGGTLTTTGSATSISFTGTTVDVDPASDLEAGLNPQTATTYGAGPLELKHGVIKTSGDVTFNGVNIPATATAVGFNPGGTTTYGTIQANNTSAVISKTGPGVMVLNPGDLLNVNSNATLEARGGTLAIGGSGGFAGASNALLNGGTMRIHAGALTEAHVKQMSMVGAWLFDEGSGSVASNSAGAGAGTITGATWVDDFDRGWVLDFEDADNVNISDPGSVFGSIVDTQSVSISVWQYGDDMIQPQSDWLFEGHNDGGRQLSSHLPWSDGQVYWDAFGNYDRINKAAETSEVSGQWNHWVFTREGGVMKMFLNGEEWHSGTGMTRAFSNISTFRIGSEWNGNNSYDGMIDEFLVFNQPLDATAVEDLYLNGVTFTALPAISMTDRDFTVAADSTLHAASDTTAAFGALTVESGTVTIAGAPGGVSFTSLTVNAPGSEGGVNLGTSATFGGPVALQAGVLKTEGLPVTFNGVDIPVTATAVGLNPISQTNYGGIDGNLMSGTVAKTGPAKLSLATGDATAMTNATWVAQEGTLEMVGAASWGGSTNATLAGGTMVLTDVEGVATPIDPSTIGGLRLRLDAGEITGLANGDTVSVWPDTSGNFNDADTVWNDPKYTADGLNGQPVVTFTNDVLSTFHNFSALEGYTMMTVSRYTGGDNERIFGSMDRNWLFGYHGNGVNEWHAEGWIYNGTVTDTDWHLHAGTITNDADPRASLWDNGVNIVTDGTGSHATNYRMDRLALGGWRDNGETSNSQIAEVLIFEGVLTEEEINGIGIYLDQKYGLDTEYRGEIAALSLPDRNYTVEADSTLNALTDFTATLGALTLQEGVATVTGAPGGVSFSSTTLPETAGTAGITAQTAVAGGPLTINAGVLRTRGSVSFDATTIPGTATAVGFDVDADVDLGVISGAGAGHQVAVSKVGSGMLSLTETNIGLEDATWVAGGGTLKMATPGSWGGSKKATLAGGTLVVSDVIGAPGTGTNPDNPLAYWSFDNVVGATVVNDGTAGAVGDGTLSGDAAIVSGLIGNAGSFDGTDDFVDVAQIATGVESASYAVWVKMGKFPPDNMDSVWHNDSWGGGDVHFLIRNSGTPGMSVNGAGPNDADGIAVLTDVGEWHHLAVVYDGVEKTRTYYFDGQQSVVRTHTNDRTLNIGPAQIAAWNSNREFEGLYDEFLIYDEALSVADVVQMFAERTAPDVSDVDVTVDANSALESQSLSGLGFKSLTINNGILTTTGLNGISFTSTTIDPNATRVGFNTTTATSLGPLDGGNTAATIAKTGSADLILSDPGSNLGNATFSADGGRLITMGTSPIGGAALQTAGGELVLTALTGSTSPVLYDKPLVGAGGTLTAGKGGQAGTADGPMTVQVGSVGVNDVTVTDSLRLRSTDGYTLELLGSVSGEGEIIVDDAASQVLLSGPTTSVGSFSVADGMADLTGANATIGAMTSTGGMTTLAGANTNVDTMTVKGGTVSTTGNDVGVSSLTLGGHSYEITGGSMAVRGPDLLSDASVVVGGGTLTISGSAALPVGNPLAYYSFDDAGNVGNDDSGNDYTGSLITPAAADADGKYGGGLFLNTGTNRQGQMRVEPGGIDLNQEVANEWTIAGWYLNLAPTGDWRTFMRGYGADHHIIVENTTDNLGSYVGGFRTANTTLATDPDVWHHIAAVGDAAGGTTIYLDGAQVGDRIAFRGQSNIYVIGGYQNNSQRFADKLDEVLIYGRALSPAEVATLMNPPVDSVDQESTSLMITGNATVTTTAPTAVLGDLTVANGVTAVNFENAVYMFNNATVADGVTVDGEWQVSETLDVGNSVGTLTLGPGELAFGSGATHHAEVDLGNGPAITADKIVISQTGWLALDGTLAPEAIGRTSNSFFAPNTMVRIVDNTAGGGLSGIAGDTPHRFAAHDPEPAGDVSDHIGQGAFLRDVFYDSPNQWMTNGVDLEVFVALGGDSDGDGKVWLSDWAALRANFGNSGTGKTWTDGNFDSWVDDKVWLSDWAALRANFGNAGYTAAGAAAVPEPGTIVMLLGALAGLGLLGWRRR